METKKRTKGYALGEAVRDKKTGQKMLSLAKTKMTEVESKIADACDKMKGFEKKES
ncbi:hypothetical protein [Leptospira weilii]|uniref:hypothetical protein n=1 Tax=Leptospira weilii TaxID=28184 RepID=UPI000ADB316A|nr:hypothetical protein [Leptospira weilii]